MAIRKLQADDPTDVETYRHIRLTSLQADPEAFASSHDREAAFDSETWQRRLAGFGDRPGATFVYELDGEVVGTVAVGFTEWDPQPMLVAMWVGPAARGQGVGQRLVEAAVGWVADQQEATEVVLWVVKTNTSAIALYQRCGFEPSGVVDTMPDNPCVDELEMRRALGA